MSHLTLPAAQSQNRILNFDSFNWMHSWTFLSLISSLWISLLNSLSKSRNPWVAQ